MKPKALFVAIFAVLLTRCTTTTKLITITDMMVKPVIDAEFQAISDSIMPEAPITVWWCLDDRFEGSPVTVISDWTQRYIEELLVKSNRFKVVTRIHLEKIFKEQEFQLTGRVDDETIVSVAKILGAKFMVVPTITQYNTLEIQVLNAETGEITYISNRTLKENTKIAK
jgi:curli biogenesis system outer membrane secretion channel CsgG